MSDLAAGAIALAAGAAVFTAALLAGSWIAMRAGRDKKRT